jgi:ABC-type sulfate transport system permease component
MPVAVYVGMEGNLNSGLTIAILLVIISFTLMIIVRYLSRKDGGHV